MTVLDMRPPQLVRADPPAVQTLWPTIADSPDDRPLRDRVVILTGVDGERNQEVARLLAVAGARLVLGGPHDDRLHHTAAGLRELGASAIAVRSDIVGSDECRAVVEAAIGTFGAVDGLVNDAGRPAATTSARARVNFGALSARVMVEECIRAMRPGSAIVNIIRPRRGEPVPGGPAALGTTLLTRQLSRDWGEPRGVRVNALFAHPVDSDQHSEPYAVLGDVARVSMLQVPRGPVDVSAALLFLLLPPSRRVSGTTVAVHRYRVPA